MKMWLIEKSMYTLMPLKNSGNIVCTPKVRQKTFGVHYL